MRKVYLIFSVVACLILISASEKNVAIMRNNWQSFIDKVDSIGPVNAKLLSLEESQLSFRLPPGYKMELVASEPMISEPVAIAWDGNARMYVAQMETYTQDADGTDTKLKKSRVLLLEDTNNDGKMDKSSVFIKDLLLPRMLLCVNNELLVNETDTYDIYSYKDTDGDGVADVKKPALIVEKVAGGNLEHQPSGLDWNLDNYIYQTYEPYRFRYVDGVLKVDTLHSGSSGQWGVAHDNFGRLFFSRAGGENPALHFQINPKYGSLDFADAYDQQEFKQVYSIIATPDVQGGLDRLRPDSTLNHFTSPGGQTIFRGDRLPKDLVGDYLVNEPVARIIRRAKVSNNKGKTQLKNAYDKQEFIASSDFFFRPISTYTGPDGCLYIVDMARGIIQESAWTKMGTFLRKRIDYYGLAKVKQRGRIWRLVHEDFERGPKPKMLGVPAKDLVPYLAHQNGWWRDNAQKQIIAIGDKSVTESLIEMSKSKETSSLGKIHALWTLEGLGAIDKNTILVALNDKDAHVRKTAIWISESFLNRNDQEMLDQVVKLVNDEDYDVKTQILLSLGSNKSEPAKAIVQTLISQNSDNKFYAATMKSIERNEDAKVYGLKLADLSSNERKMIAEGADIYNSLCIACHGPDGKGLAFNIAPALRGAKSIASEKGTAIRIMLHGLEGPIEGKKYPSAMVAMNDNSDEWIASVLSYIRFEYEGPIVKYNVEGEKKKKRQSAIVTPEDVKKLREEHAARIDAWTMDELKQVAKETK